MTDPRHLPRRITIDLDDFQLNGMKEIAKHEPFEAPDELLKVLISKGIVITLASYKERMTSEGSFPFDHAGKAYRDRHKKMIEEIKREDPSLADFHLSDAPGSKEEEPSPASHRHLPSSISVQMTEELRRSLENFLDAHHEMSPTEALTVLLQRALDQDEAGVEDGRVTESQRKATAMLRLAERLYLRTRARCLA